jgi:hypothetical protein
MTPQQATEHRRLARARTLEFVASSKIASLPATSPQRAALQRKLRAVSSTLRAAERAHDERK